MFELGELRAVHERLAGYTAGFDAALVSAAQAMAVVDAAARIEKMAATLKALAAAGVADAGLAGDDGALSPALALARRTGASVTKVREAIATARRLVDQPALDAVARRGEVSPEQAAAISEAAAANPTAEATLVERARVASLGELRDECERIRAAADHDAEERHRRIHAARSARRRSCPDGSAEVVYRSTRDEVAEVWAVVSGHADAAFHAARRAGRHEPAEAYAADAVLAMARAAAGATSSGGGEGGGRRRRAVPASIVVRVDWDALVRGFVAEGETCAIAGVGQVPVSVVRAMMESGDPFLAAVVTKGVDVVNVAHLGRRPTAHQRTALDWLAPTCQVQGCDATVRLENDHRVDWAKSRITLLSPDRPNLPPPPCQEDHPGLGPGGRGGQAGDGGARRPPPPSAPVERRHRPGAVAPAGGAGGDGAPQLGRRASESRRLCRRSSMHGSERRRPIDRPS